MLFDGRGRELRALPPAGYYRHPRFSPDGRRIVAEKIDGDDRNVDLGRAHYQQFCAGCHGADGRGGAQTFMPHIQNLTQKDYIEFLPDGYLFTVIAGGGGSVGKSTMMPAWKVTLSEQDIKDIIAHIRSLPTY